MHHDFDVAGLSAVFFQEAEEGLAAIEQALVQLEAHPEATEPLNEVFRMAHTIKGGAAMVGFPAIAELSHKFEDALMLLRDGRATMSQERVTVMLQIVDALRSMLESESRGQPVRLRAADAALITRLMPELMGHHGADGTADGPADETVDAPADAWTASASASARVRSLRVEKAKLDTMLNLSGEIAVARGRLMQVITAGADAEVAQAAAEDLSRLLGTLHDRVMDLRLVPVGPLFRQHLRTVRDLAAAQSKLVQLTLEGEDVEVDATIVEQLRDPLTHLVRNAVDHGMELPAPRHAAGKDPCGTITLRARHEGGNVIVEVKDDGRGMSRDRLLAKARDRGLVAEGDTLTDAQILALCMSPGLSTAETVTEVSGRGVGMDVVRRNIEALRGTVEILSTEGAGTTVRLRLPLTVAIIDGFVVGVGDERYVIPVSGVTECLSAADTIPGARTGVLPIRGDALPYVRLRHLLRPDSADVPVARESLVVVHADGRRVGLVVDRLHGEMQAVIKPLSSMFNDVRGVSGTTIMGDGRVSLILDLGPLLELAHRATRTASR
jgi:two-component system, chemotaxis family, sensor kinase CheA